MPDVNFKNLIYPAIIILLGCMIFAVISLFSVIHDKIFLKSTFKEWLSERKYFLLPYLYFHAGVGVMVFLMLFGFLGIFAAILILSIAGGIMIDIKGRVVFYIEESTPYNCQCGKNITKVIKEKITDEQKVLYYICRHCQKKYSKKELDDNNGSRQDNL